MRRIAHTLRLHVSLFYVITRAENCLCAGLAALVGGHISGTSLLNGALILAALAATAITAGGNVINDYVDRDIDAINKPDRPIPSGQVTPRSAAIQATVLFVLGVIASLPLGPGLAVLALLMALLSYLYSWKLKPVFLVGNVLVAFLSAMTIIYGGLTVGRVMAAIPGALVIFVFMLCREILKTAQDYRGDVAHGIRTVAAILGNPVAIRLAASGAVAVIVLAIWPWLLGQVTPVYFVVVCLGVLPVMALGALALWLWPQEHHIEPALQVTKWFFFIWLIVMLIH